MPDFAALLPAAGTSSRFGGPRNKLAELLEGIPVVRHSVNAFLQRKDVKQVVIATSDPPGMANLIASSDPRLKFCRGGTNRAESVLAALREVSPEIEWVAVHDAARPLISQELIDRTLAASQEHGSAVPALPVQLTIKQATGPMPAKVLQTLPRQQLWAMQTPQIMRRADLLAAYETCPLPLEQVTDDAQLLELAGKKVWLVPGEERNLKITTRTDLLLAKHFRSLDR